MNRTTVAALVLAALLAASGCTSAPTPAPVPAPTKGAVDDSVVPMPATVPFDDTVCGVVVLGPNQGMVATVRRIVPASASVAQQLHIGDKRAFVQNQDGVVTATKSVSAGTLVNGMDSCNDLGILAPPINPAPRTVAENVEVVCGITYVSHNQLAVTIPGGLSFLAAMSVQNGVTVGDSVRFNTVDMNFDGLPLKGG